MIQFFASVFAGAFLVCPQSAEAGAARLVTGADAGAGPHVKAFTTRTLTPVGSFFAYPPGFTGGVRVAVGDVNGDGGPDLITGSGAGAAHVKVFVGGGLTEFQSFLPYGTGFTGGVFVAAGDVNGDGLADIITGVDQGAAPHVKVFSGATGAELHSFFAYAPGFLGGVRVAAGDVNGDGRADIITATGADAAAQVKVFDGATLSLLHSFFAYDVGFTGGVFVTVGDVNGDGRADLVTRAGSMAPHVKVFSGADGTLLQSFFAYSPGFTGGVRVAAGDVNGDGRVEIITVPEAGATAQVRILDGVTLAERGSFLAYPASFTSGVFVGASSLTRPELQIARERTPGKIQLSWPSGCACGLEANPHAEDSRGWAALPVEPAQLGNRFQVIMTSNTNSLFFRLNCDDEAVP